MSNTAERTSRWRVLPGRANIVLWVAVGAFSVALLAVSAPLGVTVYDVPVVTALLFSLVLAGAVPLALLLPWGGVAAALVSATALTSGAAFTIEAPWPVSVTTTIAVSLIWLLVGWRTRWFVVTIGWFGAVLLVIVSTAEALSANAPSGAIIADLVVFAASSLVMALAGIILRNWEIVGAQLVAERALSAAEIAQREAAEEKARIARELHDVVAHGMSAIQVRAASARYRLSNLPPDAIAEFDDIAATARASMADMRSILGVLRDESSGAASNPQPTLADLSSLVDRARDLATITVTGEWNLATAERTDPLLGLTVYRAVQEALSNAARHAPGAPITITWDESSTNRAFTVANAASTRVIDGSRAPEHNQSTLRGGQGLRGMRERLQVLNGTVQTDTLTDGGFAVRVTIPRDTTRGVSL
ncbi:sensor histidine kinase [Microbacterium sp. NC79]|uniref:sensor histidine kinase n=1 Tax=Microbacterium sp. NC79 TaxID=2851009 RepID=UPI001C2BDDE2|nr:histidine kinase [Microbacterium sp. NC79]MBV0896016.1 sensor histidine kinase [Microbacterium sp. NC79]